SFTQTNSKDRDSLVQKFLAKIDSVKEELDKKRKPILEEQKQLEAQGKSLERSEEQNLAFFSKQTLALENAAKIIRKNLALFKSGKAPLTQEQVTTILEKNPIDPQTKLQALSFDGRNPLVQGLVIDWDSDKIQVKFYDDVQKIRLSEEH